MRTIFIFLVSQCFAPLLFFFVLSVLPIAVAFHFFLGFLVFLLELFGFLVLVVLDFLCSLLDDDLLGLIVKCGKLILDYERKVAWGFIVIFDSTGLQSLELFFSEADCGLLLQLILRISRLRIQVSHCQEHVASLCLSTAVGNESYAERSSLRVTWLVLQRKPVSFIIVHSLAYFYLVSLSKVP